MLTGHTEITISVTGHCLRVICLKSISSFLDFMETRNCYFEESTSFRDRINRRLIQFNMAWPCVVSTQFGVNTDNLATIALFLFPNTTRQHPIIITSHKPYSPKERHNLERTCIFRLCQMADNLHLLFLNMCCGMITNPISELIKRNHVGTRNLLSLWHTSV